MNATSAQTTGFDLTFDVIVRLLEIPENLRRNGCAMGMLRLRPGQVPASGQLIRPDVGGILFCRKGGMQLSVNGAEYCLGPDSVLLVMPRARIVIHSQHDFTAEYLILNPDPAIRYELPARYKAMLVIRFLLHPVIELAPEQNAFCLDILRHIRRVAARVGTSYFCDAAIQHSVAAFFYTLGDVLRIPEKPDVPGRLRTEEYFCRFMSLLADNYLAERRVAFYSGKLGLTPKYLTTIVKQLSGRSVGDWIDDFVIIEAAHRLRYTERSIQQIAYDLNFANQSFFGSFFRTHMKCSPSEYRFRLTNLS